jgi:hypothetical protein
MTQKEWNRLHEMHKVINSTHLAAFDTKYLEEYTHLLTKSLHGKGNGVNMTSTVPTQTLMDTTTKNTAFEIYKKEKLEENEPNISDAKKRHHEGTAFEDYCSLNPSADECKVYDV